MLHVGAGTQFDVAVQAGDTISAIAGKINAAGGDVIGLGGRGQAAADLEGDGHGARGLAVVRRRRSPRDLDAGSTLAATDARFTVDGVAHIARLQHGRRRGRRRDAHAAGADQHARSCCRPIPRTSTSTASSVGSGTSSRPTTRSSTALRGGLHEKPVADPKTAAERSRGLFFNDGAYAVDPRPRPACRDRPRARSVDGVRPGRRDRAQRRRVVRRRCSADALSGRIVLDEAKLRAALRVRPRRGRAPAHRRRPGPRRRRARDAPLRRRRGGHRSRAARSAGASRRRTAARPTGAPRSTAWASASTRASRCCGASSPRWSGRWAQLRHAAGLVRVERCCSAPPRSDRPCGDFRQPAHASFAYVPIPTPWDEDRTRRDARGGRRARTAGRGAGCSASTS